MELEKLNEENRRLRSMLDQITKNYNELQGQLLMALQKQAHRNQQEQVRFIFKHALFDYIIITGLLPMLDAVKIRVKSFCFKFKTMM